MIDSKFEVFSIFHEIGSNPHKLYSPPITFRKTSGFIDGMLPSWNRCLSQE